MRNKILQITRILPINRMVEFREIVRSNSNVSGFVRLDIYDKTKMSTENIVRFGVGSNITAEIQRSHQQIR